MAKAQEFLEKLYEKAFHNTPEILFRSYLPPKNLDLFVLRATSRVQPYLEPNIN